MLSKSTRVIVDWKFPVAYTSVEESFYNSL
jgi:hypothetical protein